MILLLLRSFRSYFIKGQSCRHFGRRITGKGLPPPDYCIYVDRIDFEAIAAPTRALRRNESRTATEKPIQHNIASRSAIHDRVGDQSDRLYRRWSASRLPSSPLFPNELALG